MKAYGTEINTCNGHADVNEYKGFFSKRARKVFKKVNRKIKKAARRTWKEEVAQIV